MNVDAYLPELVLGKRIDLVSFLWQVTQDGEKTRQLQDLHHVALIEVP